MSSKSCQARGERPAERAAALRGRERAAAVEALDPVAACDGACDTRVGRMAIRADVDRQCLCGRTDAERRATGRTDDVDQLGVWMLGVWVLSQKSSSVVVMRHGLGPPRKSENDEGSPLVPGCFTQLFW